MIERREDYLKRTGQDGTEDDTLSDSSEVQPQQRSQFPEDFESLTSKATWPQAGNPIDPLSLDMDALTWDKIIKQLESLTSCRLVKSLNERKLYIGGDSEKECSAVVSKLDTLFKYQVSSNILVASAAK